ncbi:MAG: sugar ABC transporter substrate-binding protein [Deltaproteobacteria bacterium]|nr:sugar ABC transporter substrate-binding protein [Deltaproteobacteria bacterium]MBW2122523.1 sugar ABC transporter substrate-binding protein [Deltaproteobacteria bacterium]
MKKRPISWMAGIAVGIALLVFAGGSFAAQQGKLRILFTQPYAPMIERMEYLIDEYEKLNPAVEIVMDKVPWGGSLAKITAMKAAGSAPDIIYVIPGQVWTLQREGWLMPVDDVIEKLGGDDYFLPLPGYVKVDNHYWAVPSGSMVIHLEYRKDLFERKGLKEPRTWDDLLAAAKALTEDLDGDGKIDRYGISLPLKREYCVGVFFMSFLWSNGGHVLDKNGRVVFNSPETVQTLKFFKELYKYAPPGVTDYSWLQLVETYSQDKVAMTMYSGMAPFAKAIRINPTVANGTAIAAVPTRLSSQKPKARWVNVEWAVLKDCRNPELAKDFLLFFHEPKRMTQWYLTTDQTYQVPGEKPVIADKDYWAGEQIVKYKPLIEKYIDLSKTAIDPVMEHPGILQPNTTIINQRLLITDCVQEVVLGKLSAEKAAAKAAKRMKRLVAKKK